MATHTIGTNATNSLTAVTYSGAQAVLSDADLATIAQLILSDTNVAHPRAMSIGVGGFVREGLLFLPDNRGVVKVMPGDVVAVDPSAGVGWPILISANAKANGRWTYV